MPFVDMMNLKVSIYSKGASGAVPSYSSVATGVQCRIRPTNARDLAQEGEAWNLNVTDIGYFDFSEKTNLQAERVLKVTDEKIGGAWSAVSGGDEFAIIGRALDSAGHHHHLRCQLGYLPSGTISVT